MALVEYANLDMDLYGVCAVLSVIAYVFLGYLFVLPNGKPRLLNTSMN